VHVKIALMQMDIVSGDKQANFSKVHSLIHDVKDCDLLLLPELWSTGYCLEKAGELAEDVGNGPSFAVMAEVARLNNVFVGGSLLSRKGAHFYNTFVLVAPTGHTIATYDKTHLFRLMGEDRYLAAGNNLTAVQTPFGQVGLAVCYDLRFPEIFRHYASVPVDINLLVAEWPRPRLEHWRTLLQARAIENQCFMAACNRVGSDGTSTFFGHSLVVDPWGEIVLLAGDSEGVFTVTIDTGKISEARSKIPALTDRRKDLP